MKKVFLVLLALVVSIGAIFGALAEESGQVQLEGVILEALEDGSFLLDSISHGQVLVHVNEKTVLEGVAERAAGQYVFVIFNGDMAESLPPQVNAQSVSCHVFKGTVLSVNADAKTALVESEEYSLVQVHIPEMEAILHEGDYVAVYFGGVMALSYPAQAGGLKVDVYAMVKGTVMEIGEGYFMLEAEMGIIRVNTGEETVMPEAMEVGDEVTVYYLRGMVESIPTEIFGSIVR